MKKKFRLIAGVKFYCDEKGMLLKNDEGQFAEVSEEEVADAEEVEVADEAVAEVEKMIKDATAQARKSADGSINKFAEKANKAIESMFESVAKAADKNTKKIDLASEKASFDVEEVQKGIAELAGRQRNTFSFSIKSKKDLDFLTKSTDKADLTGDVIQPQVVNEGPNRAPTRQVFMESIADVTPNMTSDALSYVEVVTETGAPAATAELATMPEKDWTFQEFKAPLKKITVSNKHSVEILNDAAQLVSAIKGWLNEDINIVTDDQLLNGSGSGANLSGITLLASVMDAAAVGTKRVPLANLNDVIRVMMTKVATVGKGKFQPNYVVLNPADADELDLAKDTTGNYIMPPFRSADGSMVKGARVIESVALAAGKVLVGDFRKLHVGTKGGVEIEMTNSDGTDFVKDILTVKLRRRIASYVRTNDVGAFWYGTIATIKATLVS